MIFSDLERHSVNPEPRNHDLISHSFSIFLFLFLLEFHKHFKPFFRNTLFSEPNTLFLCTESLKNLYPPTPLPSVHGSESAKFVSFLGDIFDHHYLRKLVPSYKMFLIKIILKIEFIF